jgi:hypothetical protein
MRDVVPLQRNYRKKAKANSSLSTYEAHKFGDQKIRTNVRDNVSYILNHSFTMKIYRMQAELWKTYFIILVYGFCLLCTAIITNIVHSHEAMHLNTESHQYTYDVNYLSDGNIKIITRKYA